VKLSPVWLTTWLMFAWSLVWHPLQSAWGQAAEKPQKSDSAPAIIIKGPEPQNPQLLEPAVQAAVKILRYKRLLITQAVQLTDQQKSALSDFTPQRLSADIQQILNGDAKAKQEALKQKGAGPNARALRVRITVPARVEPDSQNQFEELVAEIDAHLDRKFQSILTAEQWTTVQAEQTALTEFRQQALAEFTLALLRKRIFMSDEQAAELLSVLQKHVKVHTPWMMYIHNVNHIPTLPKRALGRVLNADQIRELEKIPQHDFANPEWDFAQSIGLEQLDVNNQ
jgi:hypothetical protein